MTAFVIPDAPAPTPGSASTETVEISPCPKCEMALTVSSDTLGAEVECPGCKTIFVASKKTEAPPKPSSRVVTESTTTRKKVAVAEDDEEDERPSKRRRRDEDDDEESDRPSRRRRRDEDDEEDEDERPSKRRSSRRDDDEEDDRPRKKKKKFRKSGSNYPGESKRMTAGLLALLLGGFGVHKFYLGYTNAGILQIFLTFCTGVGGFIALAEGIIYLTKSDEEFYDTYERGSKEWF